MPGLIGRTPKEAFDKFRDHVAGVLNKTVTDARLSLVHVRDSVDAQITFRRDGVVIAAPLFTSDLFLYFGQELKVEPLPDETWKLRTLRYKYRIQSADESDAIRWEYVSRDVRDDQYCRHHLQAPLNHQLGKQKISLQDGHLPTGWVTFEEIIRFLIVDLGVKPKAGDWEKILRDSEERFREWTGRTI